MILGVQLLFILIIRQFNNGFPPLILFISHPKHSTIYYRKVA